MTKLYTYNKDTLEFEPVNLKALWLLVPVIVFSVSFRLFFFEAAIIEDTNWRGEKIERTPSEYINQVQTETKYKKDLEKWAYSQVK